MLKTSLWCVALLCGLRPAVAVSELGCYNALPSDWIQQDSYAYQTSSYCSTQCSGYSYFATSNHSECYCGDTDPSSTESTSESCDTYCYGYGSEMCGGENSYSVYSQNDESVSSSASSSSSSQQSSGSRGSTLSTSVTSGNTDSSASTLVSSMTTATSKVRTLYSTSYDTQGGSTVYVTNTIVESATATSDSKSSSSSKKKSTPVGAIVGGVVGGVVGIIAIAVIILFGFRYYNKRKEDERMEKEYQEAIKPVEFTNDKITSSSSYNSLSVESKHSNNNNTTQDDNHETTRRDTLLMPPPNPFDDSRRISNGSIFTEDDPGHVLTVVNPDETD